MNVDIFAPFRNGSREREELLDIINPNSSWGNNPENKFLTISATHFTALPWVVSRDNVRIFTSPHSFNESDSDLSPKEGIYLSLELGPGLFCGSTVLETGMLLADKAKNILPKCRRLVTTDTLHVTLGYLPSMTSAEFIKMEDKLCSIVRGWKEDLKCKEFGPRPFRDVALRSVEHITDTLHDTSIRKKLIQRPESVTVDPWDFETALAWTLDAFDSGSYQMWTHPQGAQTEHDYIAGIFKRDWGRVTAYRSFRDDFEGYIRPMLEKVANTNMVAVAYFHAPGPEHTIDVIDNTVDTRLHKYGSALLLHLLQMLHGVLVNSLDYKLRLDPDTRYVIKKQHQWHITPTEKVWIAGGEGADLLLENKSFRKDMGMSSGLFRYADEDYSWVYNRAVAARSKTADDKFLAHHFNYNIGPATPMPYMSCRGEVRVT